MVLLDRRLVAADQVDFAAIGIEEEECRPALDLELGQQAVARLLGDIRLEDDEIVLEERFVPGIFEILLNQQLAGSSTRRGEMDQEHLAPNLGRRQGIFDRSRVLRLR
jgi:hypothetical protein